MMFRSRALALLTATVMTMSSSVAFAQNKDNKKKLSKEENAELVQLLKVVDDAMAGQPGPADIKMTITPYFLKSQEVRTFVPFVLTVDGAPAGDAATYLRVVEPKAYEAAKDKKKFEYPWDDVQFVTGAQIAAGMSQASTKAGGGHLHRVFMAPPGTYDVYFAMKERLPKDAPKSQVAKIGLVKTQIEVPSFAEGELVTSSLIVTSKAVDLTAPVSQDEVRTRPFVFGQREFIPMLENAFKKSDEFNVFFQVYNPGLGSDGKPNMLLEYNFHKKEGEAEKFFNKTNPVTMDATNLPPQFDASKFPIPGGITVPLTSFGEGQYRLEIKITDKVSGKTLTRDVNFTIAAS